MLSIDMMPAIEDKNYAKILRDFVDDGLPHIPTYQNNQVTARFRAIQNHYPMVDELLGSTIFSALAIAYAQHNSSDGWDINIYGRGFSKFIQLQKNSGKAIAFDWEYIAWIAGVEYQLLCLYYDDSLEAKIETTILPLENFKAELLLKSIWQLSRCHQWLVVDSEQSNLAYEMNQIKLSVLRQFDENGFSVIIQLKTPPTTNRDRQ